MKWRNTGPHAGRTVDPAELEGAQRMSSAWCEGEMNRYNAEHSVRRKHTSDQVTVRHESVGIERDELPL